MTFQFHLSQNIMVGIVQLYVLLHIQNWHTPSYTPTSATSVSLHARLLHFLQMPEK